MTDERIGARLIPSLLALAPGSGVVFRHLATPRRDRIALYRKVRAIAVARRLVLVSVDGLLAGPRHGGTRAFTAPAHSRREAIAGANAAYLFVSPVHPTRTHPGAAALGTRRALATARNVGPRVVALGGMTERRWRSIRVHGVDGWAAIDALTR